ncbi:MAG TPA: redoxin domain-containing protein [Gemmatimonadales bacterium]|nr:redoxin domain-containing protein [Gemmatimonadales bacterium]
MHPNPDTQSHRPSSRSRPLPPGVPAPEFALPDTPDSLLRLEDQRGHPVVLVFYPADWSPVCGDEVTLFNEVFPEFERLGATLLGISVDGVWCHRAFKEAKHLRFPLLADFEPKGAISRSYGVYRSNDGISERALFVIDAAGLVRWSFVSPINVNPGANGVLAALEALSDRPAAPAASPARSGAPS